MRPTHSHIYTGHGIYQTDLQSVWKVYTRKLNNISAVYLMGTEIRLRYTPSARESWKWNSWARQGALAATTGDGGGVVSFAFFTSMLLQPVCQPAAWSRVRRSIEHCSAPDMASTLAAVHLFHSLRPLRRPHSLLRYHYFGANVILTHWIEIAKQSTLHILWQRLWYVQHIHNHKFRGKPARQHDTTPSILNAKLSSRNGVTGWNLIRIWFSRANKYTLLSCSSAFFSGAPALFCRIYFGPAGPAAAPDPPQSDAFAFFPARAGTTFGLQCALSVQPSVLSFSMTESIRQSENKFRINPVDNMRATWAIEPEIEGENPTANMMEIIIICGTYGQNVF